jgi:hypothetical protein
MVVAELDDNSQPPIGADSTLEIALPSREQIDLVMIRRLQRSQDRIELAAHLSVLGHDMRPHAVG